jgi:succinate dehydrogenase / fumarate reductase, cytochrome b subunit
MIGLSRTRALQRYSPQAVRNYQIGMWAWLLHRISGLFIVAYVFAHVFVVSTVAFTNGRDMFNALMEFFSNRVILTLEMGLLAVCLYHALNGIRVLLFDLGVGITIQKQIFWGLMAFGSVAFIGGVWVLWPVLAGL